MIFHRILIVTSRSSNFFKGLYNPEDFPKSSFGYRELITYPKFTIIEISDLNIVIDLLKAKPELIILDLDWIAQDESPLRRLNQLSSECRRLRIPVLPVVGNKAREVFNKVLGEVGIKGRGIFHWLRKGYSFLDGVDLLQEHAVEEVLILATDAVRPFRILHLSDFHLGIENNWFSSRLFNRNIYKKPDQKSLIKSLHEIVREEGHFNACIISGDLTNCGQPEQYKEVANLMEQLKDFISESNNAISRKHHLIFDVMGNHDAYSKQWPFQRRRSRDRRTNWSEILHENDGDGYLRGYNKFHRRGVSVTFFFIDSTKGRSFANGEVDQNDLNCLINEHNKLLKSSYEYADLYKRSYRIVTMHHHVKPVPKVTKSSDTFLRLENAEKCLAYLAQAKIDIIFHGHEHFGYRQLQMDERRIQVEKTEIPSHVSLWPTTIIGAGAVFFRGDKSTFNTVNLFQNRVEVKQWRYDIEGDLYQWGQKLFQFPKAPLIL